MQSELEKGILRYVDNSIENAPYTQVYTGLVKASGVDGYTISLNGVEYANIPSKGTFLTNDTVRVVIPNNQYSNMFILSDSTGGGGGTGTVSSVNGMTGDVVISNVDSADKLSSAKTITLTGDVSGSVSFDGSTNVSITSTVADDSHNHVISNVDNLQTSLDAKAPLVSPSLAGTPLAPTATQGTNTTQIATTAFVQTAINTTSSIVWN